MRFGAAGGRSSWRGPGRWPPFGPPGRWPSPRIAPGPRWPPGRCWPPAAPPGRCWPSGLLARHPGPLPAGRVLAVAHHHPGALLAARRRAALAGHAAGTQKTLIQALAPGARARALPPPDQEIPNRRPAAQEVRIEAGATRRLLDGLDLRRRALDRGLLVLVEDLARAGAQEEVELAVDARDLERQRARAAGRAAAVASLRAARVAARGPQAAVAARAQGVLGRVRRVRVPVGLRREVEGEAVLLW